MFSSFFDFIFSYTNFIYQIDKIRAEKCTTCVNNRVCCRDFPKNSKMKFKNKQAYCLEYKKLVKEIEGY